MEDAKLTLVARTCKTCDTLKPINQFDKTYNKKCVNICYRHSCSACVRIKRKEYLKQHHKKTYIAKSRPKKYKKHPKKICCPKCNNNFNL